jgi:putative nucleotidyltransferase with HDIG domain
MNFLSRLQSRHNLWLKILLVTVVSVVLTALLPHKQVNFHRVDEFDAVWPYKDLITEDVFYISKSDQELANEMNELETEGVQIFKEDLFLREQMSWKIAPFKSSAVPVLRKLYVLIDSLYSFGIVENTGSIGKNQKIFVESGNETKTMLWEKLFTVDKAYQLITGFLEANHTNTDKLKIPSVEDYIAVNIIFDEEKTNRYRQSLRDELSVYWYYFDKGELLVRQNEVLTKSKRDLVNRYFEHMKNSDSLESLRFGGRWLFIFLTCLTLLMYLFFFRKSVFAQNFQVAFLYLSVLVPFVVSAVFFRYGLMLSAVPFVLTPILVRVFFDSRTALFTHLISVLVCSLFMPDKYEFIVLQLLTGISILFSVSEMRKRQQVVNAAFIAVIFYCLLFAAYNIGFGSEKLATKYSAYLPYVISGSMVLLATPLIFMTEKLFGFVSDFKLLELCDLNQPLLRRLSQEVPGTFQHSLQVANLAEEAIYYIGGNTLLVRAGAMYHDIGKLLNSGYFTENQGNRISPHLEMMPLESARIIIGHVLRGIELAKKHRLPDQIIDFIRTHHGTTTVHFFLTLQKKEKAAEFINEEDFRYPGPIPFSKETAVLMLADAVEAASRSLKSPDAIGINDLVDKIIDYKINQHQLINSDITFRDITLIKKIFKKRLMTIYHARIEYPT